MQRRDVYYSGDVQGVGFRFTTRRIAQEFPVTGYVENLPDGRVQVVVEGEETAIEEFLQRVRETMSRQITSIDSRILPYSGAWSCFEVSH